MIIFDFFERFATNDLGQNLTFMRNFRLVWKMLDGFPQNLNMVLRCGVKFSVNIDFLKVKKNKDNFTKNICILHSALCIVPSIIMVIEIEIIENSTFDISQGFWENLRKNEDFPKICKKVRPKIFYFLKKIGKHFFFLKFPKNLGFFRLC